MTLRRCCVCTTFFAVGIVKCPSCGSADHVEAGAPIDHDVIAPSRKELLATAETLLLSVPSSATKPQIQALIDGAWEDSE